MNKHKKKCDELKKVRKNIADKIGVNLHQKECSFKGTCTGTCPKCKQEEDILNKALLKKAGLIAMTAGMALSMTACGTDDINESDMGIATEDVQHIENTVETMGEMEYIEEDNTIVHEKETYTDSEREIETYIDDIYEDNTEYNSYLEPEMGAAPYNP